MVIDQLDKAILLVKNPINPDIIAALNSKGFNEIVPTGDRTVVHNFEKECDSNRIFYEIYNKPIYRLFFQFLSIAVGQKLTRLPLNIDGIRICFEKQKEQIKQNLIKCPERNILCNHCNEIISFYDTYTGKKPSDLKYCPSCRSKIDLEKCKEKDNWNIIDLEYFQMFFTPYLRNLVNLGVLRREVFGNCYNCQINSKDKVIDAKIDRLPNISKNALINYIKSLHCPECKTIYNFTEFYDFNEKQRKFWIDSGGIWFEWYIKKMLESNNQGAPIEQGIKVIDEETTNVDVIILKNKKIISFECKAINPKRITFNKVANVLNLLDFSDAVYLVSTSPLSENDKKRLIKRGEDKLSIISSQAIERDISNIFQ